MEETKFKQIEAKLFQLLAQFGQADNQKAAAPKTAGGVMVIRRRKGKPDVHIAGEQPVWGGGVTDMLD
jgi:hypothetical protein